MTSCLELCKQQVKSIINNVDDTHLENIINEQSEILHGSVPDIVNSVIEHLFENGKPESTEISLSSSSTINDSVNIASSTGTSIYIEQSMIVLQNNFQKVSSSVIRKLLDQTNNYTKSFIELDTSLKQIFAGEIRVENSIVKCFLRRKRYKFEIKDLCYELSKEIQTLEENKSGNIGIPMDVDVNDNRTLENDNEQKIECGCCYNEVAFEVMVQCSDGHLFCCSCLQNFSKEVIYGCVKVNLVCMTDGCDCKFPASQLKKALDETTFEKYMERVQNEEIKSADIKNLVKCPHCLFAAEIDNDNKVFSCQNPLCLKETCRYCQAEWDGHYGIPCEEFGKKGVTGLRKSYEEKMTEAKVRKCTQCGTVFIKSDGCNKMTCRCGLKMCYICRSDKIDYNHFCQHAKNPGEECKKCKKCNLWTDPSEDDDRAVAEIKKKAEEEGKLLHSDEISIGPSLLKDNNNKSDSHDDYDEYYGSSENDSDSDSDDSSHSDDSMCFTDSSDALEQVVTTFLTRFHNENGYPPLEFDTTSSSNSDEDL